MAQVLGVVLMAVGGDLLWSPWALVIGGVLLLVGPEVGEAAAAVRALRAAAAVEDEAVTGR